MIANELRDVVAGSPTLYRTKLWEMLWEMPPKKLGMVASLPGYPQSRILAREIAYTRLGHYEARAYLEGLLFGLMERGCVKAVRIIGSEAWELHDLKDRYRIPGNTCRVQIDRGKRIRVIVCGMEWGVFKIPCAMNGFVRIV